MGFAGVLLAAGDSVDLFEAAFCGAALEIGFVIALPG
jgi:hypothetical protein